jgi:hypothetical protein
MQSTIIKIGLVILFIGITPSYAQSKQGTPTEKPWYFSETFITGLVLMVVTGLGGVALGATKQVSQAEKDKFKREFLKEEIIPLIDQKIAANEQIKGLQLEVILTRIESNIEKLSTEIHGMYANQENDKLSVIRRFDEVNKDISSQQRNAEKLVDRLNQALQSAFGEYGAAVPTIQVRGLRNSNVPDYDTRDRGNIDR